MFNATASGEPAGTGVGTGCLGQVVADNYPAGSVPSFGTFINPFAFIGNAGITPFLVTTYFEALDFRPQAVVGTPGTGYAGAARRRRSWADLREAASDRLT
jgi:hypothetical protein